MSKKIPLRKTFSVYASDLHLATMIFPFINKEIEKGAIIKTILEKEIVDNIEKIINNYKIDIDTKEKIKKLEWTQTSIERIKQNLAEIEEILDDDKKVHIIVSGSNIFINKVNKIIDLWAKLQLNNIEKNNTIINIINCYNFEENTTIDDVVKKHEYILKTTGIEEIYSKEELKKAN